MVSTEASVVVPIPTLPFASIIKAVLVALPDVVVEIVKSGAVLVERAAMESFAQGVVVPRPRRRLESSSVRKFEEEMPVPLV